MTTTKKKVQKKKTASQKKTSGKKKGYEKKQDKDLEALEQEAVNTEEEQKQEEQPEKPEKDLSPSLVAIDPETIMFFVETPFNKLAEERGEHWKLTEYEKSQILGYIEKFDAKYGKYIPAWLAKYSLEFSGVAFVVGLIASKKSKDKALKVEHKEKEQEPVKEPTPEPGNPIVTNET